jgi:hypothetical protein
MITWFPKELESWVAKDNLLVTTLPSDDPMALLASAAMGKTAVPVHILSAEFTNDYTEEVDFE